MRDAKILIVEEDPTAARELEGMLSRCGYAVCGVARSSDDALLKAGQFLPDCALVSMALSGEGGGIDAAAQIQNQTFTPVVYFASRPDEKTFERAQATAPYGYVYLPVSDAQLVAVIETALQRRTMETRLQGRDEGYLIDYARDVIFRTDGGGNFISFNSKAELLIGYTEKEMLGRHYLSIIADRYRRRAEKFFGTQYSRKIPNTYFEVPILTKNGEEIWVGQNVQLIIEEGRIAGFQAIARDITKFKKMEKALRENEERLRLIFNNAPLGMFHFDREGVITECNAAFLNALGLSRESTIGVNVLSLNHANITEGVRAALEGRTYNYEGPYRTRAGRLVYVRSSFAPVVIGEDEVIGGVVMGEDITESVRAKEQIYAYESRLRAIIESARDAIFIKDRSLVYTMANPAMAKLTGLGIEEIIGRTDHEIFGLKAAMEIEEDDRRVLSGETIENERTRQVGGRLQVSSTVKVPLRGAGGEIVGLCGIARDITERRRVEEQIRTSLAEKETLLKEIHHRVKNNLQIISSLLNLQTRYIKDGPALELFNESQNRVKSMALIHEKLYNSRDFSSIDFSDYVRSLAGDLFRSYGALSRSVSFKLDVRDVHLNIERAIPCGLIINELISNALKHAFRDMSDGELSVRFCPQNGRYLLSIHDNGAGMPPNLDWRNTRTLGMQLVMSLVAQLGGEIQLVQEQGTEFRIVI